MKSQDWGRETTLINTSIKPLPIKRVGSPFKTI